jgi:adenine phosphoribosyltransferase
MGEIIGMLLEELYTNARAIKTGRFHTTINEFTDQLPALRPVVLAEVTRRLTKLGSFVDADKILVEEDKGAIIGSAVCLATGLPLAVARWYTYHLDESIAVPITSEYFAGRLYVNGIQAGDRVVIVDDTISTGGTVAALIRAVHNARARVVEVVVAVEKVDNGGVQRIEAEFGMPVRTLIQIRVDPLTERVHVVSPPALSGSTGTFDR